MPPTFYIQKEKETFLWVQRDFYYMGTSCSNTDGKRKGTSSIPLSSDPCVGKDQHQMNIRTCGESESTGLVRSFL